MNAIATRKARMERLVELQGRIINEIQQIEEELASEMRAAKRARTAATKALNPNKHRSIALCGTDSGYYRHRRTLNEPACEACKLAHRVAERERHAKRNQVGA